MVISSNIKELKEKIGEVTYHKALDFPSNKLNIISFKDNPIKIRAIVLDNDREYHIVISEKRKEIFHDCPSLMQAEPQKKICVHIAKLMLSIREDVAIKILSNYLNYSLTSDDIGSKRKSKNFLKLADFCLENNNYVDGLNYLNKSIINQCDCEGIIERYLQTALKNDSFIEFFEFLKHGYENDLNEYFLKFNAYIEEGFKRFIGTISKYSFFNLLLILSFLDTIFRFKDISFFNSLLFDFKKMSDGPSFNEVYFTYYVVKKNFENLSKLNSKFTEIVSTSKFEKFKKDLLEYFSQQIDSFSSFDEIKLLKKQFEIFEIPKENYYGLYRNYKQEVKEVERKIYIKKFAFLKFLIEKFNLKKSKVDFKKKKNYFVVIHNKANLENPIYNYIISHIGFYGSANENIKSTDLGLNFYVIKELFLDDFKSFPDIFYYKKQFWGDLEDFNITPIDSFSLMSESTKYKYNIEQEYTNSNDIMIVEWDLVNKPIQGSIVTAYSSQIIVPDQNNSLFYDLKPFDLCYCLKTPVKIEGTIVKSVNVLMKCSFKDAITSIKKEMSFVARYYPLALIRTVLNKEVDPFEALSQVQNNPNGKFILNYHEFEKSFREFLFEYISKEKEYIFETLKLDSDKRSNSILVILNLKTELSGIWLPYDEIIKEIINERINLTEFKTQFLNEIHVRIQNILKTNKIGQTNIFDLKKMKNTPFSKYSKNIIRVRKEEFERSKVIKLSDGFNLAEIKNTYYGQKFSELLNLKSKDFVKPKEFSKLVEYAKKLNLTLNIN